MKGSFLPKLQLTVLKSRVAILTSQIASLTSQLTGLSLFLLALGFLAIVYLVFSLSQSLWIRTSAQNSGPLFGAIARSESGKSLGYSSKLPSREEAEQAALSMCTPNCTIQVWFKDACGAFAQGSTGWGANFGMTTEEARAKAIGTCVAYNSQQDCRATLVVCSHGAISEN